MSKRPTSVRPLSEKYIGSKVVVIKRSHDTFIDDNCTMGNRHELTNAQYFGPGVWHMLHAAALEADMKPSEVDKFFWFRDLAMRYLPCPLCRGEFEKYVHDHAIPTRPHNNVIADAETAVNQGVYFKWTVDFHNFVTARTSVEQKLNPPKCQFTVPYALAEFDANVRGFGCDKCQKRSS